VETLGGWKELAEKQIKRLGAALARHTGQEEAEKTRHLFQRFAVLLAKGLLHCLRQKRKSNPAQEEDHWVVLLPTVTRKSSKKKAQLYSRPVSEAF
jgi:hypothetical protein